MRFCSRSILSVLLSAVATAAPALGAQARANPVSEAMRHTLDDAHKNLLEAASEMPPEKYAFKPTEAHMTFAQHVLHMANFNETMCASLSGTPAPSLPKLTVSATKEQLHQGLHDSFMYCTTALSKLSDASLGQMVSFYGSSITRAKAALILSGDWSDHYAVMATYLRLNGLLPPTAKK
jgi:hypothetical protein